MTVTTNPTYAAPIYNGITLASSNPFSEVHTYEMGADDTFFSMEFTEQATVHLAMSSPTGTPLGSADCAAGPI